MHEFQNLHSMYKARIQEFIRGHFYGYAFTFQKLAMVVQHYLKQEPEQEYQQVLHRGGEMLPTYSNVCLGFLSQRLKKF